MTDTPACEGTLGLGFTCTPEDLHRQALILRSYVDAIGRLPDEPQTPEADAARAWASSRDVQQRAALAEGAGPLDLNWVWGPFTLNTTAKADLDATTLEGRELYRAAAASVGAPVFKPPTEGGLTWRTLLLWGGLAWVGFKVYETIREGY